MAILSYASGFGASRMQSFCGPDVGFFSIGDCTFGKFKNVSINYYFQCLHTDENKGLERIWFVVILRVPKKNVMGFLASQILDE